MRRNEKRHVADFGNSVQKSNALSVAKLSYGLSLNQTQLLAYAVFATQQDGRTEFHKSDFEKKFELDYKTAHAKEDARKLYELGFSVEDLENDYFEYQRVFQRIKYERGLFAFKWAEDMLPHILELKNNFATIDLTITAKFRSAFSWTLYDFVKGNYGAWYKTLTKNELLKLFGVEGKKTYVGNTTLFRKTVLDVAIGELNAHSEYQIWYVPKKTGRAITHFELHWSVGKVAAAATKKQVETITTMVNAVEADMMDFLELVEGMGSEELLMLKKLRNILKCGKELTNDTTSDEAKKILRNLRLYVGDLHNQVNRLINAQAIDEKDVVPFYNWLEIRD